MRINSIKEVRDNLIKDIEFVFTEEINESDVRMALARLMFDKFCEED